MRVLFFETDSLTSEVRLQPMLKRLERTRSIAGYTCVNRDMAASGDTFDAYDVAITHRIPSKRQLAWLQNNFLPLVYDIDDLLSVPSQSVADRHQAKAQIAVNWCLLNAHRVTSPSRYLLRMLARQLDPTISKRQVYLPNAGLETPAPPKPAGRPRVLWVSSSEHFWTAELDAACRGIERALRECKTDIVLAGNFSPKLRRSLHRCSLQPSMTHDVYLRYLGQGPFVAVVPLSTELPTPQQAFIDCKSDIKCAEYGSSRIDAAYSSTVAYRCTDLPCRLVDANLEDAWFNSVGGLIERFPEGGNCIADHPAIILRKPSALAGKLLDVFLDVISKRREPVSFRVIPTPAFGRKLERRLRKMKSRLFSK